MNIKILEEAGYESALKGLALSYYREGYDFDTWWTIERREKAEKQLRNLAFKGGGHSKAIESMVVWMLIAAPRSFWQEFDTYRVGMTKNSASSMHTLLKEPVTEANFEEGTSSLLIANLNKLIEDKVDITTVKNNLPEGYIQTRQVCVNYMTLQNIYKQRNKHKLVYWRTFCQFLLDNLEFPEFIRDETKLA
jgi:hypothetical protein